jgi:hypothetical protein
MKYIRKNYIFVEIVGSLYALEVLVIEGETQRRYLAFFTPFDPETPMTQTRKLRRPEGQFWELEDEI